MVRCFRRSFIELRAAILTLITEIIHYKDDHIQTQNNKKVKTDRECVQKELTRIVSFKITKYVLLCNILLTI